ncbi:MAG TPA: UDP-3-O-(3-hydroxymyristoyl)glucosamine N-acyltransferase [Steroidobacteraceae bacterium]|nr:UDP-3-O-(3-hydroxymyristoyl)glucosamine N-acyltransferase [Steroidobacteraceae bacterium]
MSISLGELAVRFGCELRGDPRTLIDSVAPLAEAHGRALSFVADPRHARQLGATRAAAVVLDRATAERCPVAVLIAENPRATYARMAALLHPAERPAAGVHPTAAIAADARIAPSAHVGAFASIAARVTVAAGAVVGPHCSIEREAEVAEDAWLVARVSVGRAVRIGARALVHPGAVIGSDGFGFAPDAGGWVKIPQLGSVRIGADVEIGANTTIDRGAIGDTLIEEGVKLDNLIQIGHNVRIGAHTVIAGCTGISGSTTIGERCMIGGAVSVSGWLSICDDVTIGGATIVTHSISRPGVYSGAVPFEDARTWRKLVAHFKRLTALNDRVAALERRDRDARGGERGEKDD